MLSSFETRGILRKVQGFTQIYIALKLNKCSRTTTEEMKIFVFLRSAS